MARIRCSFFMKKISKFLCLQRQGKDKTETIIFTNKKTRTNCFI